MTIHEKYYKKNLVIGMFLLIFAIIFPIVISQSYIFGPIFLVLVICLPLAIFILIDYHIGVYLLLCYGTTIFVLYRLTMTSIPLGIIFDIIICYTFLALLIQNKGKKVFQWKFNEPVTWAILIYFGYFTLQIANPNAISIKAWFVSIRTYTLLLLFFIFIHFFSSKKSLQRFLLIWILLTIIISFYGIFQEVFGLREFELRWLHSAPGRFKLYFIWGHMRVFSLLSDPSAFGIFMAFSGLSFLIIGIGEYKIHIKIFFLTLSIIVLISMSFSGTRTAYAMIGIAFVLFTILILKNKKVVIGILAISIGFITIIYGPFYGSTINRIRSTFSLSEDPSMSVRDTKRIKFQSYIKNHPFGGGINTAGQVGSTHSPGHTLAGSFDPDSGYLRTAMETGFIGLFLLLYLNCTVLITGIFNHLNLKDRKLRYYNLSFIVPFLGLSIAHFAQDALYQKPIVILLVATYAIVIKIKDLDANF